MSVSMCLWCGIPNQPVSNTVPAFFFHALLCNNVVLTRYNMYSIFKWTLGHMNIKYCTASTAACQSSIEHRTRILSFPTSSLTRPSHWTQIQHGSFLSWYPSVLPCLKLTSIFSWILERLAQLIHIPVQLHVCFCCFYYCQKSLCSSGHVLRTIPAFSIICEFLDKVLMTQNK